MKLPFLVSIFLLFIPISLAQTTVSERERGLFTTIQDLEPLGIVYENASAGEVLEKEDYEDGSYLYTYEFEDSDLWLHEMIWVESSSQAANFTYEAYGEASKTYLEDGLSLSAFRRVQSTNSNTEVVVSDILNDKKGKVGAIVRFKNRNISGMLILIGLEFEKEQVLQKFANNKIQKMQQTASDLYLWR